MKWNPFWWALLCVSSLHAAPFSSVNNEWNAQEADEGAGFWSDGEWLDQDPDGMVGYWWEGEWRSLESSKTGPGYWQPDRKVWQPDEAATPTSE